jgi:hypothetical protein
MRLFKGLSLVVLSLFAVVYLTNCGGGGGGGTSGTETFTATLNLAQEVPAPVTPAVTPSGSGSATLDTATKVLTGSFTTTNVTSATAAHIHDGDTGVAGPVVIPLTQTPAGSGTWVVPATTLTDAQIARLRASGYYVNVHTALNATGEIRGQLHP